MSRNPVRRESRGLLGQAALAASVPFPAMDPHGYAAPASPLQGGFAPAGWEAASLEAADPALPGFDPHRLERASLRYLEYGLLEQYRPEVAFLARFAHSVNVATFYLCVAFERGSVGFDLHYDPPRRSRKAKGWFAILVDDTFQRFGLLRRALMVDWTPPAEVEPLTYSAFSSLCDLAPAAKPSLKALFLSRRTHALTSLVSQLDLVATQLEEAVKLADAVETQVAHASGADDAGRLADAQAGILASAGESLSLTEAARRLGTTRQNLHKRIATGSALGVMRGRELVVPSAQFVEAGGTPRLVPNLRPVAGAFREAQAGDWSLLQFLTQRDPMLDGVPLDRLKDGDVEAVTAAARAYLALDEG